MTQNTSILKRVSLSSLVLLATLSFSAKAQELITLQQAVNLTIQNNLTIKQAQISEALANEDYKQSQYNQLPSISANPQTGYNFGRNQVGGQLAYATSSIFSVSANAGVQVTLFQGGQLRNQILQNKMILEADKSNTAKVKNDLLLNVVTEYLVILTDQDLVVAAQQQVDLTKITLDRAQKNFDQGAATLADIAQAKAQISTAESSLTTAKNQVDLAILTLKQFMEMDPAKDIKVEKPDISKLTDVRTIYDASEVIKTAFAINPDIKLAELQQAVYAQGIKIAKGSYYPTLTAAGSLGTQYSNAASPHFITNSPLFYAPIGRIVGTHEAVEGLTATPIYAPYSFGSQFKDNFNQSIGLSLQIPIFNKHSARTAVRKAQLNYQNAELATQIAKNNLSKTIIQAVLDLQAAEKSFLSSQQTYQSNKEALNITKQRYDAGFVNTLDYNTAVTNYNKSQNDMIEAQYQVIFRSKVIDYYIGNPIVL